ncbi:MAG: hypothetical protein ABI863_01515 [Ginsengibacter sp.]
MKHRISITLAATSVAAMLTFTSCKKDLAYNEANDNGSNLAYASREASITAPDRIDAIVKDLSLDSYSFSFSNPMPNAGITRTAYGADNYLVYADPQDLICPEPIRIRYKYVPIWKRPNFIQPTCPDMAIDVNKLTQVQQLIAKADPAQYGSLKGIKISNGGAALASGAFIKSYSNLQLDKMDALTKGLDPSRFVLLGAPDNTKGGAFTRNFYGYADLDALVFKPYKTNLRDIIKPTIKGCFDPLILKTIRERLVEFNAGMYKGLTVTPLQQDKSIAVLN